MRIEGVNGQQWVFRSERAVVHRASFSRAAAVVTDVMNGTKPRYWTSDRYSAQQGHGEKHQTCLAHLARDVARVLEVGDERIGLALKIWMTNVFALAHSLPDAAASTIARKLRDLEKRIDAILKEKTACDVTAPILRKIGNARHQLLVFVQAPGLVEPTNNACERALRPSVITRKVTNGFRAFWVAEDDATIRPSSTPHGYPAQHLIKQSQKHSQSEGDWPRVGNYLTYKYLQKGINYMVLSCIVISSRNTT